MIRLSRAGVVLAVAVLASLPSAASAQVGNTFNIAAGYSLPTGDFSDFNDAGFSLIGGLGFGATGTPIRFRAEAFYNQFNHKSPSNATSRAGGFTGNAVYDFAVSRGTPFTPYAIGGIGMYGTRIFDDVDSQWNVGWNLGLGLRFPLTGFSVYLEGRYHSVSSADVSFAPIVFGVTF
jgi:opacity protein-like surface antigen